MNDPLAPLLPGSTMTDVSRARALELLNQQRRQILELSDAVINGQRRLSRSTASLTWRSSSRFEFDIRVGELHDTFASSAGSLRAALAECDRARDLLQAGSTVQQRGNGWSKDFAGHPAGSRSR
jgi:hypothetical protein